MAKTVSIIDHGQSSWWYTRVGLDQFTFYSLSCTCAFFTKTWLLRGITGNVFVIVLTACGLVGILNASQEQEVQHMVTLSHSLLCECRSH